MNVTKLSESHLHFCMSVYVSFAPSSPSYRAPHESSGLIGYEIMIILKQPTLKTIQSFQMLDSSHYLMQRIHFCQIFHFYE